MLILLLALGCRADFEEYEDDRLRVLVGELKSKKDGFAGGEFEILEGETAMLSTAIAVAPTFVHTAMFQSEDRVYFDSADHYNSPNIRTSAFYTDDVTTLNYPWGGDEPDVVPGRHQVQFGVVEDSLYARNRRVQTTIALKQDPDFSQGVLPINLILAGDTAADNRLENALDMSLEVWADLYAAIGIELEITRFTWDEPTLEPPGFGDRTAFVELSEAHPFSAVNVVIVEEIEVWDDVLGVAGDIPGPLASSAKSAVVVSSLTSSGQDGRFNTAERRILGETLAHEVGHFIGLFHPVEEAADWGRWDALDDTAECDDKDGCEESLGANVMFPYPVCDAFSCAPQTELTSGQGGVANRYVAVR